MVKLTRLTVFLFLSGCATLMVIELDKRYGVSQVENRLIKPQADVVQSDHFTQAIQPIIEKRCVVCHGCYDAPCQLKMESRAGIERGANKTQIYNGERLLTANISEDLSSLSDLNSENLQSLRKEGFFPVLNERQQTKQANTQASLFYQMLHLKKQHPLPNDALLDSSFDVSLSQVQQCPTIEEFESYKDKYPLAGMPYGLPGLSDKEHGQLTQWLTNGAVMPKSKKPTKQELNMIDRWEVLLNGKSAKEQLIARYLFEHLYLANLYFDEQQSSYFRLVRSLTPSGEKVALINTRRPFDSPFSHKRVKATVGKPEVFYRLIKNNDTITAKRHMPYPFGKAKLTRINELFYQPNYTVNTLPDYKLENASNPFKTFQAIPSKSRYQFLLDQAQFSIMNFIKGPVCRGQIALNVIEDNFWVVFLNPDNFDKFQGESFIEKNTELLQLPAGTSDKTMSLLYWQEYATRQSEYIKRKLAYVEEMNLQGKLNLDLIWSGNGNPNATLTVFRHFDSASVLQGFVGNTPKTAWLISYPLLERIHYLLVAGFDVYGNVGHQLKTRLYMDFLRMEAESNFISFLPKEKRKSIHEHWYRDTGDDIKDYIFSDEFYQFPETSINYQTKNPKKELYQLLAQYTKNTQVSMHNLTSRKAHQGYKKIDQQMAELSQLANEYVSLLPQVSYVLVNDSKHQIVYSLINNSAHTNVAHLFSEEDRRIPQEDTLIVLRGVVGTYPNAFFKVDKSQLKEFVEVLTNISTEKDYQKLKDKFAIRRTHPDFWQFADEIHTWYKVNQPKSSGLLDFNRLENR